MKYTSPVVLMKWQALFDTYHTKIIKTILYSMHLYLVHKETASLDKARFSGPKYHL